VKAIKFKSDHRHPIIAGAKVETRRLSDPGVSVGDVVEAFDGEPYALIDCCFCWGSAIDPVHQHRACRWCKGTTKVPNVPFATLKVVDTFEQRVGELTDDDARAEGYARAEQLWDALLAIYDELDLGMTMFVVRFELLEAHNGNPEGQIARYERARRSGT